MTGYLTRSTLLLSALVVLSVYLLQFTYASQNPFQPIDSIALAREVLEKRSTDNYCSPTGLISDSCSDFETVERINNDLFPKIQELVKLKFFKYYKLDLYKECPFWEDDSLCMNRDCTVATVDESEIPEEWRAGSLGAIENLMSPEFQPFKRCDYKDQDFCLTEDEATSVGAYVDLTLNPERFTGYGGPSAYRIWRSIYEENCFNVVHKMTADCPTCAAQNPLKKLDIQKKFTYKPLSSNPFAPVPKSSEELEQLLTSLAEESDSNEVCLEKRVFYRLISGLHSSISMHICDQWFNQTTGVWGPNLECFITRIGSHPERLQNIYFDYLILLRAVTKLADYLKGYKFCVGNDAESVRVKTKVDSLLLLAQTCPSTFDESLMFATKENRHLKEEFRDHFRNISRIMDCVGCEKCRLWGKLQVSGLGTALKVLFSYDDKYLNPRLHPNLLQRTEIVALFNTLNRFSESLKSIEMFRKMYQENLIKSS